MSYLIKITILKFAYKNNCLVLLPLFKVNIIIMKLTDWKHRSSVWKKTAVRYMFVSINCPCMESKWNSKLMWLFTFEETRGNRPWGFREISNARKQGGVLGLAVSWCGNSLKPLVRFPSKQCRESGLNQRLTVSRWGNQMEITLEFPRNRNYMGNHWCHDS